MAKARTRQLPPVRQTATARQTQREWRSGLPKTNGSVNRTPVGSSAPDTPAVDHGLPRASVTSVAFALGWQLAELDLRALAPPSLAPKPSAQPEPAAEPDQSWELSSLLELATFEPASVVIPLLGARLGRLDEAFPQEEFPSTDALAQAYSANTDGAGSDVHEAVCVLHCSLAGRLNAVDGRLAMAYDLGRRLAYLTQSPHCVHKLAKIAEHDEVSQMMADLSVALPEHSARAVQLSLGAWHEWLSATAEPVEAAPENLWSAGRNQAARKAHTVRKGAQTLRLDPAHRPLWKVRSTRHAGATEPERDGELTEYLRRQGLIWRALLAGDKDAKNMLDTSNYEKAAHQLSRRAGKLICRMTWTNKWAVGIALVLIAGGVYAVIALSGTAKVLTFGTAVLGILGVSAKSAGSALQDTLAQIGTQLWGAEVDVAAAQAITRLPAEMDQALRFDVLSEMHRAPGPAKSAPLHV